MTREVKATVNKPKGRDAVCSGTHLPLTEVNLDAPLRADSGEPRPQDEAKVPIFTFDFVITEADN